VNDQAGCIAGNTIDGSFKKNYSEKVSIKVRTAFVSPDFILTRFLKLSIIHSLNEY
jgi:hypothetical protein